MTDESIAAKIERLESYVCHPDPAGNDRDHALLELCALRLQHLDVDPQGAGWAGRKLQELLDRYYSGQVDIAVDKGDPRSAFSRNGRDPWTGLSWPAAIFFEYQSLSKGLRGSDKFERLQERLTERGYGFGASTVKASYYEAKSSPQYQAEIEKFCRRFNFPKSTRISGK